MSESPHIVKSFTQELEKLRDLMTEMGGIVEHQVALATQAIVEQEPDYATRAVQQDAAVDALERQVEALVIRLLALRQPMASDLRQIVAGLKISNQLERIGDYAKNVAKRSIVLGQFNLPFALTGLATMARLVQENLRLVIDSVSENDAAKSVQVWQSDEAIDDLYNSIFPRVHHLHDGRSAQHHAVHASAVHRQEPRADRGSCDQHRRDGALRGDGHLAGRGAAEGDR